VNIDPRLFEGNDTSDPGKWLEAKLTVIIDVWVAEYLRDPARADERLRQNGFLRVADQLIATLGENWWDKGKNPSVGAISQALQAHDEQASTSQPG
jgi:hypothetical protein